MEPVARIPKDRIAVIIGKSGATRKMIEEAMMKDDKQRWKLEQRDVR